MCISLFTEAIPVNYTKEFKEKDKQIPYGHHEDNSRLFCNFANAP
jgi:hypothetical protein